MSKETSLEARLVKFAACQMNLRERLEPLTDKQSFHATMLLDSAERIAQNGIDMGFDVLFLVGSMIDDLSKNKK